MCFFENSELVTGVLKLECKMLAKMSALSLMIFEGISVSWNILETCRFKISLNKSSVSSFWKWKSSMFLFSFFAYFSYSEYAGMFSVFYNQFNNRIINIIRNRIVGDLLRNIKATYNVWKKRYSKLELCFHHLKLFHFLLLCYFFLGRYFVWKKRFNSFLERLVISNIFFIKVTSYNTVFVFLNSETQ